MKRNSILLTLVFGVLLTFTACKSEKKEAAGTNNTTNQEESTSLSNEGDVGFVISHDSKVNWLATKVGGKHNGTINITSGKFNMEDNEIVRGKFQIDMNSIDILDLDGEWKDKLMNHLKGTAEGKEDHFFNVAKFPTATFEITKVGKLEGQADANTMIYGNLTVKGISNPVGMTANVKVDGNSISVESKSFTFDRTKFGVNYNSKTIFPNIQDNIISDDVQLSFKINATRA